MPPSDRSSPRSGADSPRVGGRLGAASSIARRRAGRRSAGRPARGGVRLAACTGGGCALPTGALPPRRLSSHRGIPPLAGPQVVAELHGVATLPLGCFWPLGQTGLESRGG